MHSSLTYLAIPTSFLPSIRLVSYRLLKPVFSLFCAMVKVTNGVGAREDDVSLSLSCHDWEGVVHNLIVSPRLGRMNETGFGCVEEVRVVAISNSFTIF